MHGDSTIKGAWFWRNSWEGLKDGGKSTISFAKSLGTAEVWMNLSIAALTTNGNTNGDNVANGLSQVPSMTKDDWGHAVRFGTEKLAEGILLSKGVGLAKNAFSATADFSEISTLYHSTASSGAASSILNGGINPAYFNSASRFGAGFYMAGDVGTTISELSYHGAAATNTIQFGVEGGSFMNATSPVMSLGVKYVPKLLGTAAHGLGYDGVMYNSLRASGTNVVQFKNFGILTNGKLIP